MKDIHNRPLVSIGMPVYNAGEFIQLALNSLINQTYNNIEIIISDNASTDNTHDIIKHIMKSEKRIRYYRQKINIPAVHNFNFTLSKAKGEYFMWAAGDDLWKNNYISSLMEKYKTRFNTILVSSKFNVIDNIGIIKRNKKFSFIDFNHDELTFEDFIKEDFYGFKTCIFYGIYKTAVLKKIGGYLTMPVLAASDYLTVHRIMAEGKVQIVNKVLFLKRERFYKDKFNRKNINKFELLIDIIKTTFKILKVTTKNFLPQNFLYIFKNAKTYYVYNTTLIKTYFSNRVYLHILNFISSFNLFITLFPNDIEMLKNRNKIFSGD